MLEEPQESFVEQVDHQIWKSLGAILKLFKGGRPFRAMWLFILAPITLVVLAWEPIHFFAEHLFGGKTIVSEPQTAPPIAVVEPGPRPIEIPAVEPTHSSSPAAVAAPSFIDKYVDRHAHRVVGKTNVTLRMIELPGAELGSVEGAVQQVFRNRGYNVMPLFRKKFSVDGLDRELFDGSASLADKLELRKYCDDVVLGSVRFMGPPRNVQGLLIAEVILTLRVISPATGAVLNEKQIREKGSGSNARTSSIEALRQLEKSMEEQLAEWSWT